MSKNILITGGAGYIGSHIYLSLFRNNYNPIILDNFSRSNLNTINCLELITKSKVKYKNEDVRNKKEVIELINKNKIEAIIHLAAFKSIEESTKKPELYYNNNVLGLRSLLDSLENTDCRNIVFSSSASVYIDDNNHNRLFQEDDSLSFKNPYAKSKLECEMLIQEYSARHKVDYSILRYFNPAGSDSSNMIGEFSNINSANLFPNIARVATNKNKYLKVFGNDYDTNDGFAIRDYIHITDLSEGHISALEFLLDNKKCEIFNLGSGIGYSVMQVIKKYESILNKNINIKFYPRRNGDSASVLADISKAKNILNWQPKKNLTDMCLSSWLWECKSDS
tara:strand:- start:1094 stop:2104 length:1011 start_codon:yes stop_codon:yes gene_type:complete